MEYSFSFNLPNASDLAELFTAVGWGEGGIENVARSLRAYPCIVHARHQQGQLVGYISAFSDGVFSTMLGELVVHPEHRHQGIASRLLKAVETRYPGVPIYVKALGEAKNFFTSQGYRVPGKEMTVLYKKP